jgi:hypothetical protein
MVRKEKIRELFKNRYKNYYGKPFELTDGQLEIAEIILTRGGSVGKKRIQCLAYTRYGKSETVSMAVLTRITTFPEKWAIVAPSGKKAKIIMSALINHTFDNEYTIAMFDVGESESLERIRRERSKDRMTYRHPDGRLGEVFTLSSEGKRTNDLLDALMGFGCFPYDELVLTDVGYKKIGDVVKDKRDKIASFNHKGEVIEFNVPLSYQKNKRADRKIVEIDLGDKKIKATEDHPIFVEGKGYVEAGNLKVGDCVLDCSLI